MAKTKQTKVRDLKHTKDAKGGQARGNTKGLQGGGLNSGGLNSGGLNSAGKNSAGKNTKHHNLGGGAGHG